MESVVHKNVYVIYKVSSHDDLSHINQLWLVPKL